MSQAFPFSQGPRRGGRWFLLLALALSASVASRAGAQQTRSTLIVWGQGQGEASLDVEWHFWLDGAYAFTVPFFSASAVGTLPGPPVQDKFQANVPPMPIGASLTGFACRVSTGECSAVSNALIVPPDPTATATLTQTATRTLTISRTPTVTMTPSATRTLTATTTRTPTRTGTATSSGTPTRTQSTTGTATHTQSPTATETATDTPTRTPTDSPTVLPTASPTQKPLSAIQIVIIESRFGEPTVVVVQRTQTPEPTP